MLYLIHLNSIEIKRGLLVLFMIDFLFAERVIIYGAQARVLMACLPSPVPLALVLPLWWTRLLFLLVVFYRAILGRPLSLHSHMACSSRGHLHLLSALRSCALLVIAILYLPPQR